MKYEEMKLRTKPYIFICKYEPKFSYTLETLSD